MTETLAETKQLAMAAETENDLACSAWNDHVFAVWFMPFAKSDVLFNGGVAEAFFTECGEFAKKHKAAFGSTGDTADTLLKSNNAKAFFKSIEFAKLPGEQRHKPTTWQREKAERYLASRHNLLLAEALRDAEQVRTEGDIIRANSIATNARRRFTAFTDSNVRCVRAMDDIDAIVALAESNPALFTLEGEVGNQLNPRLKPDNLGVILANQKVGKTTTMLALATTAGRSIPTLFVSCGDETHTKIDARVFTNLSCHVTQPEFAGTFAMPIPDCVHNASGTCPINMSGEPRIIKDWKSLIDAGAKPSELIDGSFDGSRTTSGGIYQPCCRCYPMYNGTKEDIDNRRRWKSAIWWRNETFDIGDRKTILDTRNRYELDNIGGGLRVAAYPSGELTVQMLEDKLDSLDRTENFVPLVVVLDYADLMKQTVFRDSDKDHDGMRMIWEGLRAITFRRGILLITATQSNRNEVETHTIKTIGRCAKAADNCTWMLTLNQTIAEKRAKVMRASMLFAREGAFDPEHQALCYQWQEVQDSFAFSTPIFCKTKHEKDDR